MRVRVRVWLEGRYLPLQLALLAVVFGLPSLDLGLQVDDYFHRLALTEPPLVETWARGPASLFVFFYHDPEVVDQARAVGAVPWWTSSDLVLAFFRPVSGLTHWLDWRAWPDRPVLMHLHSLLWFAAAAALATVFLRRVLDPPWLGGLAALLFVVDDGHGLPVVWIANRNAMIGVVFALAALVAHLRWRRGGGVGWLAASLVALTAGLLANEGVVAVGGYLAAYALCCETGTWPRRLTTVLPAGVVVVVWLLLYHAAGYGAVGSAVYVEPMNEPAQFVLAVLERGPVLLAGQLGLPIDSVVMFAEPLRRAVWVVAMVMVGGLAVLFASRFRRDPAARFLALGMAVSVLPACATFLASRLLMLASIGGAGVMAMLLADLARPAHVSRGGRAARRFVLALLVLTHLVLSPLSFLIAGPAVKSFGSIILNAARSLPPPGVGSVTTAVVNTPSAFVTSYGPLVNMGAAAVGDGPVLVLGSGIHATTVERVAERELVISVEGGFLARPGTPAASNPLLVDPRYVFQTFDLLYTQHRQWRVGETVEVGNLIVEVVSLTPDGRPLAVSFSFPTPLDGREYVWLRWYDGGYVPFTLPAVGEQVVLPAPGDEVRRGQ